MPELVRSEIEAGEAGKTLKPPVAAGVHGQGDVRVVDQEGDSVPGLESRLPPEEVFLAGRVDFELGVVGSREALVGQDAAAQQPAGSDDVRRVDKAAREGGELLIRSEVLVEPVVDEGEQRIQFGLGKGNRVFVQVVAKAQSDAGRGWGGDVAG